MILSIRIIKGYKLNKRHDKKQSYVHNGKEKYEIMIEQKKKKMMEKLFYENCNKRERLEDCNNIKNMDVQCSYCKILH